MWDIEVNTPSALLIIKAKGLLINLSDFSDSINARIKEGQGEISVTISKETYNEYKTLLKNCKG